VYHCTKAPHFARHVMLNLHTWHFLTHMLLFLLQCKWSLCNFHCLCVCAILAKAWTLTFSWRPDYNLYWALHANTSFCDCDLILRLQKCWKGKVINFHVFQTLQLLFRWWWSVQLPACPIHLVCCHAHGDGTLKQILWQLSRKMLWPLCHQI